MEAVPSGTDLEKRLGLDRQAVLSELTGFQPDTLGFGTTGRDIVSDHAELVHLAGGNYILTSRGRAAFADLSAGNDTAMIELMSYWRHLLHRQRPGRRPGQGYARLRWLHASSLGRGESAA